MLLPMRITLEDLSINADAGRITAVHPVRPDDEYLSDHFAGFPILPGVLMLETMVEAARRLLMERDPALGRHVLGRARAVKYGSMVRPGRSLRVEIDLHAEPEPGVYEFRGVGTVADPDEPEPGSTVSGRFTLRPIRAR